MKKLKKLIVLIIVLLAFAVLHCYTEDQFSTPPAKGMTEQIEEWVNQFFSD